MSTRADLMARRRALLGARAPLFYDEPLHIVRGEGVWLYDAAGRAYLDVYNNVPLVGHCQPDVVAALARQAATLNVHTRYLHETILDYGERLVARLDPSLSMVMFVCTGSEANDQALRIARLHTGGEGVICTNLTYHGNTTAVDESLTRSSTAGWHRARACGRSHSRTAIGRSAGSQAKRWPMLTSPKSTAPSPASQRPGVGFAGMVLCPVFANEGLPDVPPGFMHKAVARVRAAGGLFIADEVQAGFGRTGRMWGHELAGVVPDIVTMGKPMGNGHPLAAVVARADLIEEFRDRVMYFNTFGGNPVSCAVGNAVLDVLDRERLSTTRARSVPMSAAGLARLQQRHTMIGDIRGHGLWIGVEFVRDRVTKEPATEESHRAINLMKERGVLMGRIGQFDNVLKMRPPLPFSRANADLLLATLDEVLGLL